MSAPRAYFVVLNIYMKFFCFFAAIATLFFSCATAQDSKKELAADKLFHDQDSVLSHSEDYSDTIRIKYAKGLKVEYKTMAYMSLSLILTLPQKPVSLNILLSENLLHALFALRHYSSATLRFSDWRTRLWASTPCDISSLLQCLTSWKTARR